MFGPNLELAILGSLTTYRVKNDEFALVGQYEPLAQQ